MDSIPEQEIAEIWERLQKKLDFNRLDKEKLSKDIIKKGERQAYIDNMRDFIDKQVPPDYKKNKERIIDAFDVFWNNSIVNADIREKTQQIGLAEVLEQEKLARETPTKPIRIKMERPKKITYYSKTAGKLVTRRTWTSTETVSMKNNLMVYFRRGYTLKGAVKETAKTLGRPQSSIRSAWYRKVKPVDRKVIRTGLTTAQAKVQVGEAITALTPLMRRKRVSPRLRGTYKQLLKLRTKLK